MYITDTKGNLKFRYSAGLVDFKGKLKKSRIQILTRFLRELRKLKMSTLKIGALNISTLNMIIASRRTKKQ